MRRLRTAPASQPPRVTRDTKLSDVEAAAVDAVLSAAERDLKEDSYGSGLGERERHVAASKARRASLSAASGSHRPPQPWRQ